MNVVNVNILTAQIKKNEEDLLGLQLYSSIHKMICSKCFWVFVQCVPDKVNIN